jgi:hypothetical protein
VTISTQADPPAAATRRRAWDDLLAVAGPISAGAVAGLLGGFLVGGIGGRLAMLALRLTSDPALRGLETDDGFTIGIFSGATAFLIVLTTIAGMLGGLVYLVVRSWIPGRARPWVFGTLAGLVGGAMVIRPGGIDFTRLEPLGLAVAMFVAIPFAYGVLVSVLAERFLEPGSAFRTSRASILGPIALVPALLLGGDGFLIVLGAVAAYLLWRFVPGVAAAWSSAPATWSGRAILVAVGVAGAIALARDLTAVL